MQNTNKHSGHRKRLRKLINNVGLASLSDVQIVEQILTMTNARKDTNEVAHNLLDRFGNIAAILDAHPNDLTSVDGVGEVTAQMISYLPQIFDIYTREKQQHSTDHPCKTYKDVYNFFAPIYKNIKREEVYIAYINKNEYFMTYEKVADGDFCTVKFDATNIHKSILKYKPHRIIICHNHPNGIARPSQSDYESTKAISSFINILGVELYDNIIIGEKGFFSTRLDRFVDILNN